MRIYIRTSNHPSAHVLAYDHQDFLDLQDEHWPITDDTIDGDSYWNFKLILRERAVADLAANEGPSATTFILTRSRDKNEDLVNSILQSDADDTFFNDHDIEEISTTDNNVMHSFKRLATNNVSHVIRLKVETQPERTAEFLQKLEDLFAEYNSAELVNTTVVVNEEVIFDAIEQATA